MSEFRTFFRHCPACGRRFEIRLVKKAMEKAEPHLEDEPVYTGAVGSGAIGTSLPVPPTVLVENVPVVVNDEEFDYTYRCKHCGHQWSEVHDQGTAGKAPEGYTGD